MLLMSMASLPIPLWKEKLLLTSVWSKEYSNSPGIDWLAFGWSCKDSPCCPALLWVRTHRQFASGLSTCSAGTELEGRAPTGAPFPPPPVCGPPGIRKQMKIKRYKSWNLNLANICESLSRNINLPSVHELDNVGDRVTFQFQAKVLQPKNHRHLIKTSINSSIIIG